jgi:hypothetical protein
MSRSDDGSLRVYDLSSYKVLKAVRGLGAEVSSIICVKRTGSELRDAWMAHGQKVRHERGVPKIRSEVIWDRYLGSKWNPRK